MIVLMQATRLSGSGQERPDCRQILAHDPVRLGHNTVMFRSRQGGEKVMSRPCLCRRGIVADILDSKGKRMIPAQQGSCRLANGDKETRLGIWGRHLALLLICQRGAK